MPDVGEVRYKAAIDTNGIDQDIRKTEGKLFALKGVFGKIGSAGITAIKGIGTTFLGLTSAAATGIAAVSKMGL